MSIMQKTIEEYERKRAVSVDRRQFSHEEKRQMLALMVACGGSATRASEMLREQGVDVGPATLRSWKRYMRDDYERIHADLAPKLEKQIETALRETAMRAAEVERKAIDQAEQKLERGTDYDPAKTAVNMAKIKASALDRLLTITGRPAAIIEHRTPEQLVRSLVAQRVLEIVPEDVEELTGEAG